MAYLENCSNIPPGKQRRQLFEKQKPNLDYLSVRARTSAAWCNF